MITIGIIILLIFLTIGIALMRDDDLYRWLKKNKFIR